MSANTETLDDHQKFVLMKFRRSVSDVLQKHHNDQFLLRWLRARSWNPEAAEKMLRQSLKWRQQWEVDGPLKTWTPPEVIEKYHPSGTTGYDKSKAPVIVVPFAGFDVVGLIHSASKQDLIRMVIQTLERNLDLAAETGANKVTVVFDMEGFNLKQYAWRPAAELVISLIQMYEANYPEILKVCYIINAPRVFAIAFNVVKRFLNEYTLGKIQIYKSDPKKWKKIIVDNIGADSLPQYLGGNLADPDGNPRYTTKIRQGGKVPKEYYKKKFDVNPDADNSHQYTTAVVKKGGKLSLDFIVAEEGCFLKWDFRTEGHDIRFGITVKDADDVTTPVILHSRVAAHQIDESGVLACQAPATYTVTFDNSYSLLRSKTIHYNIVITPPLDNMDLLPKNEDLSEEAVTRVNEVEAGASASSVTLSVH